jgi:CubicO group peptidase (beta-lactamase class C family)
MRFAFITLILFTTLSANQVQASEDQQKEPFKIGLWPAVVFEGDQPWTLTERMEHYGVPGVGIALVKDFKVAWFKTYGLSDREAGTPVTSDTLFQAGSISKPVAAFGALQMVEAGQLNLDANVNESLDSWTLPDNEFTKENKVNLRQLLSHTGGLTVHGFGGYPPNQPVPSLVQVLDGAGPANSDPIVVNKTPGGDFRYSGGGYTIAQQMMIDASGKPFPQLMNELLLSPAKMNQSTYMQPLPADWLKNAAAGVLPDGTAVPGKRHTYPEMAAAGLWTTAKDLALFVVELQNALRGNSELMSMDMARIMVTSVDSGYALGLGIKEQGGTGYFGHGGWDEGFSAEMVASVDEGYGVVVMINSNHPDFIREVIRGVGFAYGWGGYDVQKNREIPVEILDRAPGRYRYDSAIAINVYVEDGRLFMRYTGEQPEELFYIGDEQFMRRERDTPIRLEGSGKKRTFNYAVNDDGEEPRPLLTADEQLPAEVLEKGNFDGAVAAYRKALESQPDEAALSEGGINSSGLNILATNITFGTEILKINTLLYPESANTWDSLGYAYKLAGNRDKAIENYKAALKLDPEFASAKTALKQLAND